MVNGYIQPKKFLLFLSANKLNEFYKYSLHVYITNSLGHFQKLNITHLRLMPFK